MSIDTDPGLTPKPQSEHDKLLAHRALQAEKIQNMLVGPYLDAQGKTTTGPENEFTKPDGHLHNPNLKPHARFVSEAIHRLKIVR